MRNFLLHFKYQATCKRTQQLSTLSHFWAIMINVGSCCVRVGRGLQTDATTPNNVRTCSESWKWYNPQDFVNLKETMCSTRTWPQQCWKSCANGSNIAWLRFSYHGTKEMSGVKRLTGFKICATTCNSVCKRTRHVINIKQCWEIGSCWPTM